MNDIKLAFLFIFLASLALADNTESCQNYINCLEKLEGKQRECRENSAQKRQIRQTSVEDDDDEDDENCSKKQIHEIHDELMGLHLRKTEQLKDCINENLENAVIVASPEMNKKCQRIFEKIVQTNSAKVNKKAKKGGKKQRRISQKKFDTRCRKDRRIFHKKCAKIGECCNLVEQCREKYSSLTDQIIQLKSNLKKHRIQCKNKN